MPYRRHKTDVKIYIKIDVRKSAKFLNINNPEIAIIFTFSKKTKYTHVAHLYRNTHAEFQINPVGNKFSMNI